MPRRDSCDCVACCSYPNGPLGILAGVLAFISYCLALFATYACHYVDVDLSSVFSGGLPSESGFGFGLYSREHNYDINDPDFEEWSGNDNYHCYEWTADDKDFFFDSKWKAARGMGALSTIFGFFTLIFTMMFPCVRFPTLALRSLALCAFMSGLFSLLTLVALSSNICDTYNCKFGDSAGVAIAGGVLFLVTACVVAIMPAPAVDLDEPYIRNDTTGAIPGSSKPAGTVEKTETVLPDGTKKTETVTYNADGSKTVQEVVTSAPEGASEGAPESDPEQPLEGSHNY